MPAEADAAESEAERLHGAGSDLADDCAAAAGTQNIGWGCGSAAVGSSRSAAERVRAGQKEADFAAHRRLQPCAAAPAQATMRAGGGGTDHAIARDSESGFGKQSRRRAFGVCAGRLLAGTGSGCSVAENISARGKSAWKGALAGTAYGGAARTRHRSGGTAAMGTDVRARGRERAATGGSGDRSAGARFHRHRRSELRRVLCRLAGW